MKIKTINISHYRKVYEAQINMEDNITVIVGANNSGKTSLVEVFNSVFSNAKGRLCFDDLSAVECQKWSNNIYPKFYDVLTANKTREDMVSALCEIISPSTKPEDAILMPPIELKIQVDYNEKEDDIRNFADYIMEFEPSNTSFYFIYRYALNVPFFRKAIDCSSIVKLLRQDRKMIK
ncbi:AAA family ATPase [Breznakia pachnodae]|uniref:AAA15 family ATPase/GTPase n=1 Tax=Breznakia pachnodae TaxID=265178 RepID=A0ABU0E953_9FIRM|nr:AAA family ATPase [Breznakia pachnodae]MDQ0363259.1 AAA15 family ATPase/GTPase [Breznakia pachnodae]